MKRYGRLLLLILSLVFVFSMTACLQPLEEIYEVTFDSAGGTQVESQSVEHAQKITEPPAPTKAAHVFDGWYYNGEKWSFAGYVVTEDMTLVAKWISESYTITYELGGGVNNPDNPSSYTMSSEDIKLSAPSREGYEFSGWTWEGQTTPQKDVTIQKGSTGAKTFIANWTPAHTHTDKNNDAKCDECGIAVENIHVHTDKNNDKKCDGCNATVQNIHTHSDSNYDNKCDECGGSVVLHTHVDENGDKRCDLCNITANNIHKHKDENRDNRCDGCGKSTVTNEDTLVYPWADDEPVNLIFQLTHNSNYVELPSGCSRYLAGGADDPQFTPYDQDIDAMILERNTRALEATNVAVRYQYYDDTPNYGWGNCIEIMYQNAVSGAVGNFPDMYCNFTYDMVSASIKGAFNNLKSTNNNYDGANYFAFLNEDYDEDLDNEGYMYDYMCSTTLNPDKMYILASDYFTDLIRAFFIVPVNKTLLEAVGMQVTGDKDEDGVFTIEDFYAEVKEKQWNYNKIAAYSNKIYKPHSGNTGSESIDDILGFAISAHGLAASGLLYSSGVTVIDKTFNETTGKYEYEYPEVPSELIELFTNAKTLVESKGVYVATSTEAECKYGTKHLQAIRTRFCDSKILFGDVMLVGALEYEQYQTLKDGDGFGVVPVPLYHEVFMESSENYLTTIHNVGRSGAIAANTAKFAECTAFLNYQSTHSTDILNEYYEYNLQYAITDGSTGTVEMMQFIRSNVRSALDKTFEDALSLRFKDDHKEQGKDITSWHGYFSVHKYAYGAQMSDAYDDLRDMKQEELMTLERDYDTTPS